MEICFTGDDGSGRAKASGECAIGGGDAVVVPVKRGTAGRGEPDEVKAVFEGDGNTPERLVGNAFAAKIAGFFAGPV